MRKNILIFGHNDATQFVDIYNQYTRLFDKDKYEVTVVILTGAPNEDVRNKIIADHVIFLDAPKSDIRGLKIATTRKMLAMTREKKFEIVICHRYKPSYIMMWVAQFCKIPALFFVMHELRTMSAISRKLVIAALSRKNMIFAGVSNAVRDDMRKDLSFISNDRIITLYNVIDVDLVEPQLLSREDARKALGLSEHDFIFGNLARLVPNKDQKSLIDAFSSIKPECPNTKLIILGTGLLEDELKQQVQAKQLDNDVIFTGFVSNGFRYMKAFDCFVLSSTQEAFGRVLIEAMIAKIPIIATRVNGIPEVMGNVGTLVNPRDSAMFAQAMKNVYNTTASARHEIGNECYQHAVEHFSIPTFYKQFWSVPVLHNIQG